MPLTRCKRLFDFVLNLFLKQHRHGLHRHPHPHGMCAVQARGSTASEGLCDHTGNHFVKAQPIHQHYIF